MDDFGLTPRGHEFGEREATEALYYLFNDGLGVAASSLALHALLSGVHSEVRERVVSGRQLWVWWPGARLGPDLGLVDEDGNVVAVFEHKRGAPVNYPALDTLAKWSRYDDPVARSLPVPDYTPGWHTSEECSGCAGWWHTKTKNGRWMAALPQVDVYRSTAAGWVRALEDGTAVRLEDPANVLWVVLDCCGRPAEEIFRDAHTADQWWTTGYAAFAAALLDAYTVAREDGVTTPAAMAHLGRTIEMFVYL
jgi:hypothetical protein